MNDTRKKIEEPIAGELQRFREEFADSLKSETHRLQQAVDLIMSYSGKHVRPLLVLLTAKALGEVNKQAIDSAIMIELLHTSSLIHDDVIDVTKQRRGQPSLNAIFDNRISVLVGDYILASALIRSTMTNNMDIIHVISQVGRELAEGEIKQMETADDSILDEDCYMEVIRKKTAALLAGCAQVGAISAGAKEDAIKMARLFGEYIGICFQIKDDIFDYYHEIEIGKPTGNDIREGKITLPLLYALKKEQERGESRYMDIIRKKDFTVENVEALIAFAKQEGGIEYAESRMKVYRDKAVDLIETLPSSHAKESLLLLADYSMNRTK